MTGSQATNIGWINVGGGEYRWYVKGEMDVRKRFMNQREMMMLSRSEPEERYITPTLLTIPT